MIEKPEELHDRPCAAAQRTCRSASAFTAAWACGWPNLQLKIIWEEILKRFDNIEVVGEPKRIVLELREGL
jgi:hypothetical protein